MQVVDVVVLLQVEVSVARKHICHTLKNKTPSKYYLMGFHFLFEIKLIVSR